MPLPFHKWTVLGTCQTQQTGLGQCTVESGRGACVCVGGWCHTCMKYTPMKASIIYFFMVHDTCHRVWENEENGLAGHCGMECLIGASHLLPYWLCSPTTHPTLLILYYFHPCPSVWDIPQSSENVFRLLLEEKIHSSQGLLSTPINVLIHVQCCKGEETRECGW